jgi:hypothetical protein
MKFLLSVIAVCLVMITSKLYIPKVEADVDGMNAYELASDREFKRAVQGIVGQCYVAVRKNAYVDGDYADVRFSEYVTC